MTDTPNPSPAVHVRREQRAGGEVAFITLDNARRLNVMSGALMDAFVAVMADLGKDDDLREIGRAHV